MNFGLGVRCEKIRLAKLYEAVKHSVPGVLTLSARPCALSENTMTRRFFPFADILKDCLKREEEPVVAGSAAGKAALYSGSRASSPVRDCGCLRRLVLQRLKHLASIDG